MNLNTDITVLSDELYISCSLQLYDALVSGKGLTGLLNIAASIFNNPILIADASFKVLAHIEPADFADPLWKQIINSGYYPSEYIQVIIGDNELYNHVFGREMPALLTDAGAPNRYMCKMIKVNGKPVGFSTCIEYDRKLTELDIRLFDIFCKVVGTELRTHDLVSQYHTQRYEYLISEILSGTNNADSLAERVKQVGLKLKSNLFVMVTEFKDKNKKRDYQMEYFRSMFEQIVSCGYCVLYRNAVVIIFSQDHKKALPDFFVTNISPLLDTYDMVAGISHRFVGIENIHTYYKQACEAIRIGRLVDEEKRLFDYAELYYYHLLDIARQSDDLRKLCNPKLLDIIEYDAEYNTCYASTARIYFNTNRNIAQTAKLLNIHRNTIDYRIKRLEELFDLNLNSSETAFSFDLSFRILHFLSIQPYSDVSRESKG